MFTNRDNETSWMVQALDVVRDSRFDIDKNGVVDSTDVALLFAAFGPAEEKQAEEESQ